MKLEKSLKKSFSEVNDALDQRENLTVHHDDVDVLIAPIFDSLKDGLLLLQLQLCRQHNELLRWKRTLSTSAMFWLSTVKSQHRRQHVLSGDIRCYSPRSLRSQLVYLFLDHRRSHS